MPAGQVAASRRPEYVPGESSEDTYRLQLWTAHSDLPSRELKRWPGYDVLAG